LAEAPRKCEELRGREVLVAEEDHEVLEPRPADVGVDAVVERGAQIDARDLGAERARDGMDGDRHAGVKVGTGGPPSVGVKTTFMRCPMASRSKSQPTRFVIIEIPSSSVT